ncbi:MAG: hypothetical protein F8N36_11285 [Desulfovibrio sp.]|uniref:hypothetical protein n=1 Tax=Desulfovibrio sp. TaxID=885 RepID=UPI00135E202B|nr:hypothetical protein [Desulfovibrio sp.]MTJ93433.1 hypothetical protein [Desulfovibrio sp.]
MNGNMQLLRVVAHPITLTFDFLPPKTLYLKCQNCVRREFSANSGIPLSCGLKRQTVNAGSAAPYKG